MEALIKKLEQRNYKVFRFASKAEVKEFLVSEIKDNEIVAWGGSMTVNELGIKDALKNRKVTILDRDNAKTAVEKRAIQIASFDCDTYLMSTNAITQDGLLVNIDGIGNRVANLIYGAKNVYVIVGKNKICESEAMAIERARHYVAPRNAKRLGLNTPCNKTGECKDCISDICICSHIVISRRSWIKGRVNILLIDEELGI